MVGSTPNASSNELSRVYSHCSTACIRMKFSTWMKFFTSLDQMGYQLWFNQKALQKVRKEGKAEALHWRCMKGRCLLLFQPALLPTGDWKWLVGGMKMMHLMQSPEENPKWDPLESGCPVCTFYQVGASLLPQLDHVRQKHFGWPPVPYSCLIWCVVGQGHMMGSSRSTLGTK